MKIKCPKCRKLCEVLSLSGTDIKVSDCCKIPLEDYYIKGEIRCSECGAACKAVPLRNDFDYAATHCTHGQGGTHFPDDYGTPVSDCCEAPIMED